MGCELRPSPNGGMMIVCSRGVGTQKWCVACSRPASKLCDYPLKGDMLGQTCSRLLCDRCTTQPEQGVDYCPAHARLVVKDGGARSPASALEQKTEVKMFDDRLTQP